MKLFIRILFLLSLFFTSFSIYAAGYQKFYGIGYDNPALLKNVKKMDVIVGDTYLNNTYIFRGSNGPLVGTATSHQVDNFPYGRIAYRINEKVVVGIDVARLAYVNIQFPIGSILQRATTASILKNIDYSPRISIALNPKLAIGLGINANNMYEAKLNFVSPPNGNLVNSGSGWSYGWNIGGVYTFSPKTILGITYYSNINHNLKGSSYWGAITNNNFQFINVPIPAVLAFNLIQTINDKFMVSAILRYQMWSTFQYLVLQNTALGKNVVVEEKYNNSWIGILLGKYKFTDKFAGILGAEYDTSPQDTIYRGAGLPTYKLWAFIIGGEYAITKSFSTKLIYARAYSNPPISKPGALGLISGRENITGNTVDLSFTYHI